MNEELNKAFAQISDDHLTEATGYQKPRVFWLRSVAAMLGVVIAWIAIWAAFDFKPPIIVPNASDPVLQNSLPSTPSEPTKGDDIQNESPSSYFYFESLDEINGLFQAASLSDQEFTEYVQEMEFHPSTDTTVLREGTYQLQETLEGTPLPYLDGSFTMYYYYERDLIELFIDQEDIRYHFLISTSDIKISGTPTEATVSIEGTTFKLFEKGGRLYGSFEQNGKNYSVGIFTDDLNQVDLSGFTLELLPL